ncbi:hypothetical protein MHU86_12050 [Fragilaria crotonensis]|nr:hypothetical protein MHU86_12050 [Fragilaria crotonensis]
MRTTTTLSLWLVTSSSIVFDHCSPPATLQTNGAWPIREISSRSLTISGVRFSGISPTPASITKNTGLQCILNTSLTFLGSGQPGIPWSHSFHPTSRFTPAGNANVAGTSQNRPR